MTTNNTGFPTAWEAKVVPITHRTYRGARLRQTAPTQAESAMCDHVHRHQDTALKCARRLVKEVQP